MLHGQQLSSVFHRSGLPIAPKLRGSGCRKDIWPFSWKRWWACWISGPSFSGTVADEAPGPTILRCSSDAPQMLLYGYCTGVYSTRKIAKSCEMDLAFRVLSGSQFPDFRTLSDFRKEHLEAFQGLFLEVLRMCREAGMVRMGHLSLDGSKYQANACKHKAMSYGRIEEVEPQLEAEIRELLRRAAAVDEAEDAEYGPEQRGDELPEELPEELR